MSSPDLRDSESLRLINEAWQALGSARHAARPRGWWDRFVQKLFPKRTRRVWRNFETLELLLQISARATALQADQLQKSCAREVDLRRHLAASDSRVDAFRRALNGVFARDQRMESRLSELETFGRDNFASKVEVTDLRDSLSGTAHDLAARLEASVLAIRALETDVRTDLRRDFAQQQARLIEIDQSTKSQLSELQIFVRERLASKAEVTELRDSLSGTAHDLAARLEASLLAIRALETDVRTDLRRDFEQQQVRLIEVEKVRPTVEGLARAAEAVRNALGALADSKDRHTGRIARLEAASLATSATILKHFAGGDSEQFAQFYLAFENRYRGSEHEIRERLRIYIPRVQAIVATPEIPVIDLGCGRGEWLDLLREQGLAHLGVDTNRAMLDRCREHGLSVVESDALQFLCNLPAQSARAITAFHLIEHLPFPILLAMLSEARRVLVPGGLIILETPSCHNLLVAATTFHSDPTHQHPLPATLTSFALEHTGFADIELLFLHPYPEDARLQEDSPVARRFNDYFYGGQDYALVARHAG